VIRFRFELRPIGDIEPWGAGERPELHWFGLTDGWYWIELAGHELLRYSPATLRRWRSDGDEVARPYVGYYVARLWEDLIGMLPGSLEPVPGDLVELVSGDRSDWRAGVAPHTDAAALWYGEHCLDLGYLRRPPHIRWWRTVADGADVMTVAWRSPPDAEIGYAAPTRGRARVPTDSVVTAMADFDRALLAAMARRITDLATAGPPPGVHVDMPRLRAEQRTREKWFKRALGREATTDWAAVRRGATALLGR
jgi:hypothetical protein